jgi:DNA repair exonuclease SbcCD ATPase subunit
MIEFQTIRWKNFLSTGNNFTSVDLNRSPTTLILGTNGAGKSTILDGLTFGLFGRPFRKINKPQLVNSVNEKDCLIEIEFKIGSKSYKVKRGIKPNVFEIWNTYSGVMINQDSKAKDYQKYLEENILKLNYKSFTQTVILGSATFVPFMQLSASDRRDIIEDLLDIKIFTTMNDMLKIKQIELKDELFENDKNRELTDQKIDMQERYIESADANKQKAVQEHKGKIALKTMEINSHISDVEVFGKQVEDLNESISDFSKIKKKQSKLDNIESQLMSSSKKHTKDIKWFESIDSCPTCKQSVTENHKKNMISDKKEKVGEIENAITALSAEFKSVNLRMNKITSIQENISNINSQIAEKNTVVRMLQKQVSELTNEIGVMENDDSASVTKLNKELKDLKKTLSEHNKIREELLTKREYYTVSSVLLKDTGVKTSIIKYYLPKMNKLINKYLQEMDFYVNFTMDEKFSENIKSRGRENFSYASFSEGEKMRIDLALLFTWRAIAKMKNSVNTNLLILDEVFDSSLDNSGTDEFLKLLNTLGGNNVFVISHKGEILYDKFRSVIKFDKVKNFSQIVEEK